MYCSNKNLTVMCYFARLYIYIYICVCVCVCVLFGLVKLELGAIPSGQKNIQQ